MADLQLKNISKSFGDSNVIDNLNLDVRGGEFVTLLGPSGCGKTTILRMVAGLEPIEHGTLFIGGKNYNNVTPQKRRIAMVFQSYALFPHMTVKDNILFGLKIKKVADHELFDRLSWVVPMLGLEGLEKRLPKEISGGQRQRVALARALVLNPDVLLLDEPLSNLDAALRDMAMEELKRVHRQVGKTILYVTHNQVEAMTMSDRIAVLNQGRLEQYDIPKAVYDHPRTCFSAGFIGSPTINLLQGEIASSDGVIGTETEVGFFRLDKDRAKQAENMLGRKVTVGVRPQNVFYAPNGVSRRHSDTRIELVIDLVETLGDRSLVVARGGEDIVLRFLITRDDDLKVDEKVVVFVDGRRIHAFDPATDINIFDRPDSY